MAQEPIELASLPAGSDLLWVLVGSLCLWAPSPFGMMSGDVELDVVGTQRMWAPCREGTYKHWLVDAG